MASPSLLQRIRKRPRHRGDHAGHSGPGAEPRSTNSKPFRWALEKGSRPPDTPNTPICEKQDVRDEHEKDETHFKLFHSRNMVFIGAAHGVALIRRRCGGGQEKGGPQKSCGRMEKGWLSPETAWRKNNPGEVKQYK